MTGDDTTTTTVAHLHAGTTRTGANRVATIGALHHAVMIGGHIAIATITMTVDTVIATATLTVTTAETGAMTDGTTMTIAAHQLLSHQKTSSSSASTRN